MSAKEKNYTNELLGKVKIVEDFLPHPDELVLKEETVKVTLSLTRSSFEFFKGRAKDKKVPYQKMIRNLLDQYAIRHLQSIQ
jgi:predicted DNA binding CopG/RHH family protein